MLIPFILSDELSSLGSKGPHTCRLAVSWHIPAFGLLHWSCSDLYPHGPSLLSRPSTTINLLKKWPPYLKLHPTLFPKLLIFLYVVPFLFSLSLITFLASMYWLYKTSWKYCPLLHFLKEYKMGVIPSLDVWENSAEHHLDLEFSLWAGFWSSSSFNNYRFGY